MPDLLPSESWRRQLLESRAGLVFGGFGYRQIRLPVLERTELFCRSVGENTDIVEKEMYSFTDRDGESITLRPEGTAGTVRACLQRGLIYNQSQRFWYGGPMFRHDRPQKGRYRQFEQIGAEAFGIAGAELDAELIQMCHLLFQNLEIGTAISLQLNSIGSPLSRQNYQKALVSYLAAHQRQLDPDSQRRLKTNPLRILDSKNSRTQSILGEAPNLMDFLEEGALKHFELLQSILRSLEITFTVNPRLVRGLDYYTDTVFEFVTEALGAQGTVCGGGRYDGLVEQLGGQPAPGAGFAMGVDRLALLHEALSNRSEESCLDIYCLVGNAQNIGAMMALCQSLRLMLPGIRIALQRASGKYKNQIKRAQQSGARWLLTEGDATSAEGEYALRWLREERATERLTAAGLGSLLSNLFHREMR